MSAVRPPVICDVGFLYLFHLFFLLVFLLSSTSFGVPFLGVGGGGGVGGDFPFVYALFLVVLGSGH